MDNKKNITSPIYYVNGEPHIGHAYTTLACDIQTRFWRKMQMEVVFCTGTDEHGQKVANAAKKSQISPQNHVDIYYKNFVELNKILKIDEHIFIRTTEERHKLSAQHLWNVLKENGHIYLGEYKGWYSERDETFFAESDLVDGKAPTGASVEFITEKCYFLKLSSFQDKLLKFYENNPEFVLPQSRFNEVKSFVKNGLKDLAISRSHITWGIPIPHEESNVMYVWIDALSNYITCLGYPELKKIKDFMPVTDHVVGKDILTFHAIYWPIMLMGANLPLPKRVIAHGWWKNGDEKMSKSLGNVVKIQDLISIFGLDAIRFFLFREVPFGQDGNISQHAIISRINSDLANNFGNLIHRTISFCIKNIGNELEWNDDWQLTESDKIFLDWNDNQIISAKLQTMIENYEFHKYLEEVMSASKDANQYIDMAKPWEMKKSADKSVELKKVIYLLLKRIFDLTQALWSFMPDSCEKILLQLGYDATKRKFTLQEPEQIFSKIV